jgi:glycosyltransferase involved in cell wall biosynthesis
VIKIVSTVAIFVNTLWPLGSGGELATYLYAKLMQDIGVKPIFIVNELDETAHQHKFKVISLRRVGRGKYSISLDFKALVKILRNVDVTYFVASDLELIPFVKMFIGKPVVVHIHSYYPLCPIGHMYNFYRNKVCDGSWDCARCIWKYEAQRRNFSEAFLSTTLNSTLGGFFLGTLRLADAIIFVSEAQRRIFLGLSSKKGMYISPEKTYVIYNPLPDLKPVEMEGDDIGFLGGFDPIKGFKTLYEAWKKIFPKHPQNRLYVAKGKPSKVLEKFGIIVYRRLMPPTEILRVIRIVRALVVPSLSPEPAPYVCVETLLYGRLLVASNIGGIPEIVGGLPGARLTPPGDVDKLADALEWILSLKREEAVELSLRNREGIIKRFDNSKSVKQLIEIFEKLSSR